MFIRESTNHFKRSAIIVLWALLWVAWPKSASAQVETVVHNFLGPSTGGPGADGAGPYAGLIMDSAGNLYGTTETGGAFTCKVNSALSAGCGTVFELVNASGSYTEKVLYSFAGPVVGGTGADGAFPYAGLIMDSAGNLYGTTETGGGFTCASATVVPSNVGCGTVFELVNSSGSYTEKVLYSFAGTGADGAQPLAGLIGDSAGNLYGTTYNGGAFTCQLSATVGTGCGTVFELVNSSGSYTEKVLYNFAGPISGGTGADGAFPSAGLIMDSAGNLYGTTAYGGAFACQLDGCGTVFKLVNSSGSYTEKVLYNFAGPSNAGTSADGAVPRAGLIMNSAGNLYGTTVTGGTSGNGTIFELVNASGSYTEKVLYSFAGPSTSGTGADGAVPDAGLIMDSAGNFYGTTAGGGTSGSGTIFELINASGTYTEKVLLNFGPRGSPYGSGPLARLIMDSAGNLYGTTSEGGSSNVGIVFKFSPTATAPSATLSAATLDFGSVGIGAPSPAQTVTVTNTGSASLTFTFGSVTISGTNAADFAINADTCSGASVAPSASCSVAITFTPSISGNESAILNFADNAANSRQTVGLAGVGLSPIVAVMLSPASLYFGSLGVGANSPAQTVSISNTGNVDLTVSMTLSGANVADFSIYSNTCSGPSLAPGSSCSVSITFTPSFIGGESAMLDLTDNAANSPQSVNLSGSGTGPDTVLYSFAGPVAGGLGADGAQPIAGLVMDSAGNLYGTTNSGGAFTCVSATVVVFNVGCGTVFELVNSSGGYTEKVLYSFAGPSIGGTGDDGAFPYAGLIMDSTGNLYGTTYSGGAFICPVGGAVSAGCGTVFELVNSSGRYTEKVLHSFGATGADGAFPYAGLIVDSAGNLYGTTQSGGMGGGVVFELANSSGSYMEKVLYSFGGASTDGASPYAGLIMDSAGNLYGTTYHGGVFNCLRVGISHGCGTVFELVNSSGSYTEKVLHNFGATGADGAFPYGGLIMDSAGNLYGTTQSGGMGGGVVFELANSSGSYMEKVLHSFPVAAAYDATEPDAGLIMDSVGNLYGITDSGGAFDDGTVFELFNSSGSYMERVLYSFGATSNEGQSPQGGLVMDSAGNLYGTTSAGGSSNDGIVFKFSPTATAPSAALSAAALDFGSVGIGAASPAQTVIVTNAGSANLTFATGAITVLGTNTADFAINADTCSGARVAPAASCSVSVAFKPSIAGVESAMLSFADNARNSPQSVSVSGSGVAAGAPGFTLSSSALEFGSIDVRTTSPAQTVTVTNTGSANLIFATGALTVSGTNASDFSIASDTCRGVSIGPSAFCSVSITFKPSFTGSETAILNFADNAANSPQALILSGTGSGPHTTILYSFVGPVNGGTFADGASPRAGLIMDSARNLYGTTTYGGTSGNGAVFELTNSSRSYAEKVLYSFVGPSIGGTGADGAFPYAGLIMDSARNLYGTTYQGGKSGSGTVFELVNSSGSYTEKVLYSFAGPNRVGGGTDGGLPQAGLIMDSAGNLYGTTSTSGPSGGGIVFELVNSSGSYTEKILHTFLGTGAGGPGADGVFPYGGLIMDSAGNLYGTTYFGGAFTCVNAVNNAGCGTVFELVNSSGSYMEKVLYNFAGPITGAPGADGAFPSAGLIMDSAGNLYGTTSYGGTSDNGVVFELVNSSGTYKERVLYSFGNPFFDGQNPAGLIMDSVGNLYGTTSLGGFRNNGSGTVFELVNSSGSYSERVLHNFIGDDGEDPSAGLLMDSAGNLYGTTGSGGNSGYGVVFEFGPTTTASSATLSAALLDFGAWVVGATAPEQMVTLTNSGSAILTFASGAVTISGTKAADFAINADACSGKSVTPSASCSVSVIFKPSILGNESATLNFADNAPNGLQTVSLSGTGKTASPTATLSTTTMTFSPQTLGTTSAVQSVTVTNGGSANLTFVSGAVTISGTNAADFAINADTCSGKSVTPSASCSVSVTFKPSVATGESATLNLADNASGSPQSVSLSGTGVTAAPTVTLSPSSLTFGSQAQGTTSMPQTVTLTNNGNVALSITRISISPNFAETNDCGASVGAGKNCTINVAFSPTTTGTLTGTLSIADNAAGSPQTMTLSGTGIASSVALSPSSLSFPGQLIATTSPSQKATLTNTGSAALSISSIAITGTNGSNFGETNTCPAGNATLAVNASCTINVAFTPAGTGNRSATLTITDNASDSPQSISLAGIGSDYSLAPASGSNCPAGGNCSTSATVTAGQAATYDLQVTPSNGFNGTVALSCSGATSTLTCSVSPSSVPPSGSSSYAFDVAVSGTAGVAAIPFADPRDTRWLPALSLGVFVLLFVIAFLVRIDIPFVCACPRRATLVLPTLVLIALFLVCIEGCGGGSQGTNLPKQPVNATLTVTGSLGNATRTVSLSLTVNPQ